MTNGTAVIAAIPKVDGRYDLKALSELALSLKRDHPDVDDASVLLSRRSRTTTSYRPEGCDPQRERSRQP